MTDYAQGCRKAFFPFASPRAAIADPARRRVHGLGQAIAPLSHPHPLQQRLHARRRVVDFIVRDMS